MKTLKTTCLLIAVTLQFSASCFSQDSSNALVGQSGNPSSGVLNEPKSVVEPPINSKELFLSETEGKSFLDGNSFQFNAPVQLYISYSLQGQKENKKLSTKEPSTKQQKGSVDLPKNTSKTFSDTEIIKLAKYIKSLEDQIAANNSKQYCANNLNANNPTNYKSLSDEAMADFVNQLSDNDLAKLANYIKNAEKTPRVKEISNENEYAELLAATNEILTLKEYTLREQLLRQNRFVIDNGATN